MKRILVVGALLFGAIVGAATVVSVQVFAQDKTTAKVVFAPVEVEIQLPVRASDGARRALAKAQESGASVLFRAKVPGGWFVSNYKGTGFFFYPDAKHSWVGRSLK